MTRSAGGNAPGSERGRRATWKGTVRSCPLPSAADLCRVLGCDGEVALPPSYSPMAPPVALARRSRLRPRPSLRPCLSAPGRRRPAWTGYSTCVASSRRRSTVPTVAVAGPSPAHPAGSALLPHDPVRQRSNGSSLRGGTKPAGPDGTSGFGCPTRRLSTPCDGRRMVWVYEADERRRPVGDGRSRQPGPLVPAPCSRPCPDRLPFRHQSQEPQNQHDHERDRAADRPGDPRLPGQPHRRGRSAPRVGRERPGRRAVRRRRREPTRRSSCATAATATAARACCEPSPTSTARSPRRGWSSRRSTSAVSTPPSSTWTARPTSPAWAPTPSSASRWP